MGKGLLMTLELLAKLLAPHFIPPHHPLETEEMCQKRQEEALFGRFNLHTDRLKRGLTFCQAKHPFPIKDPQELLEPLSQGVRLTALLKITHEDLEALYQEAIALFQEGDHPLTASVFLFLTALEPLLYPFWLGLAYATFKMGDLDEADHLYKVALLLGQTSDEPRRCYLQFLQESGRKNLMHDIPPFL